MLNQLKHTLNGTWVCLLAAGLMMIPATVQAQEQWTDLQVSDAVEDELIVDPAVLSFNIDVATNDGIVTLSGKVDNILAKQRAGRIAETVKGVKGVVNNIRVSPSEIPSDAKLAERVEQALLRGPATDSYEVEVEARNGAIILEGKVDSWQERELVAKRARGVGGVTEVDNRIEIAYESDRTDLEIKPEIQQALKWDTLVDQALIDVKVNNGNVELTGTVGSAAEKRRAEAQAWVAGVDSVDTSGLEVERWARDEDLRAGKYMPKSDSEIEEAVEDTFLFDPLVNSLDVEADVSDRVVTLRGEVDSLEAKRSATRDARQVVGVDRVINRLKVRPDETLDDSAIADRVRDALLYDPYVEEYEIGIDVENGVVTLTGDVESFFEKRQADDAASQVLGTVGVVNRLSVEDEADPFYYNPYVDGSYADDFDWYDYEPTVTLKTDSAIKEDIHDQLWWSPFVDSDEVNVEVDNGVAELTGEVDTWSEYRAARSNALEGGAKWVVNRLEVEMQ